MENYKPATILALAALCCATLHAQVPAKCFEIESILADACISDADCPGSSEGMNEMVRFITGPAPIAIGDLQFEFFSSTFQGISQNTTTATLTDQLNATVQGCGHLLEPPGGIIPPGSQVIFVTSTEMCVQANSFAALNDTLYIIFQNAGNSQGHFKNNSLVLQPVTPTPDAPLLRWLRMSLTSTGCADTATYDANLLVNVYGSYGGTTEENDGATALFSWPGQPVATYVNLGCQAPFTPIMPTVVSGGGPIACGASASLVGSVTGDYASVHWQGGGGAFSDPDSMSTTYTPGGGDNGDVYLSLCAITACNDTVCTQVMVTTGATPQVTISGDTNLCSSSETTLLTASGADSYLWSTGITGSSIVADITGPTSYWVVGTNSCGSDTAYVAPGWMQLSTYNENVSCNGAADGTLSMEGTNGVLPYSFTWSTGSTNSLVTGLAAGTYSYTIEDAEGCTISGFAIITEPPALAVTAMGDTAICPGGQAVLTAQGAGGTPGYTYTWTPEGPVVSPSETTVYTVVVTDAHGCQAAPAQVTVNVTEEEAVITSTAMAGCAPHCVTFTASPAASNTYTWDLGDGTTATDSIVEHCYSVPGSWPVTVLVDLASGCPSYTDSVGLVTVGAVPDADFSWTPATPTTVSPEVQFTDLSTGATTWAWSFGDPAGSVSADASPTFSFPGEGCFPVSLVVTSDAGCADSISYQICISGQDTLLVPNVFTPNGDGQNDVFHIKGGKLTTLEVQIFNRWGQAVARIDRVNQVWDGRDAAGQVLSEGTYFYTLHALGQAGTVHDLSGTVTLLR